MTVKKEKSTAPVGYNPGEEINEEQVTKDDILKTVMSKMDTASVRMDNADILDELVYRKMWRGATTLSRSGLVPDSCRGNEYTCFTAFMYAKTMGVPVTWVLNNAVIINGKFSFEGAAVHDRLDNSGLFKDLMEITINSGSEKDYEKLSVTVSGVLKNNGKKLEATWTYQQAVILGWVKKSKDSGMNFWTGMPLDMCINNAFKRFQKRYFPGLMGGVNVSAGDYGPEDDKKEDLTPFFIPEDEKKSVDTSGHESNKEVTPDSKNPVITTQNKETKVTESGVVELSEAASKAIISIIKILSSSRISVDRFEKYITVSLPMMLDGGGKLQDINTKNLIALSKDMNANVSLYRSWENGVAKNAEHK